MSDSSLRDRIAKLSPEQLQRLMAKMEEKEPAGTEAIPRVSGEGPPALSFAQQRLWFLHQLDPGSAAYNMSSPLRLKGPLDLDVLKSTLEEIVRRHDSLRTSFPAPDGSPSQAISPDVELDWTFEDVGHLPVDDREPKAREIAANHRLIPFDLSTGPVFRVLLVRMDEEDHGLFLTTHHIVSDGWSLGILNQEITTLYEAFSKGEPSPLPELPIQYSDFASWQRDWMRDDVLSRQLKYWEGQLKGVEALDLPTDRPRPPTQTFVGGSEHFFVPPAVRDGIQALAQKEGVTQAIALQAVFNVLLNRYTNQEDIAIGSPIANRNRQEIEGLIGFFVNSLVMRTDLSGDPTARELIHRVREVAFTAYDHQDLPFEHLVDELQPERDPSRNPIFQVMFAVQNAPLSAILLEGLTVEHFEPDEHSTRFDLECHWVEFQGNLLLGLLYNVELFEASTIQRLGRHYLQLLASVVADPDCKISALPMLSDRERAQVRAWRGEASPYPRDETVEGLFRAQALRTPEAVAVEFQGQQLTYEELDRRSDTLALWLQDQSVGPGTLVGLCADRSLEMVVGVLGIIKAGGAYVPLDPDYPVSRLQYMLEDTDCQVLLTQRHLLEELPVLDRTVLCLDDQFPQSRPDRDPSNLPGNSATSLAYVMYTSGSTGQPKGTCIEHRSIVRLVKDTNYAEMGPESVFLQYAAMSFDAATLELWGSLLNGGRLVVCPPGKLSLAELADHLSTHGVNTFFLTSAVFQQMVEHHLDALLGVPQLMIGGEAISVPHMRRALDHLPEGGRITDVYGPTENTTFSTFHHLYRDSDIGVSVPIGKPVANTTVRILDQRLNPVPVGVPGELFLGGDGLAREYLNRPELTAASFIDDPEAPGERLYRTGDVVRFREGGVIEFMGRRDDQVKLRGFRIELGEVESALAENDLVQEAFAMVREDEPGDRRLVAYLVPKWAKVESAVVEDAQAWEAQYQADWQVMYEETYGVDEEGIDPTLDLSGWNSSYTGQPIPQDEMEEWVASTVGRIRTLQPRSVLEVGCGTGLLLARVAPDCDRYVGTDFSPSAVRSIEGLKGAYPELAHVEVWERLADDFADVEPGSFDAVIINSVSQYLPTIDYLERVLENAATAVKPGGHIFVGDVRNLPLLPAFHTTIETHRSDDSRPVAEWRDRAEQAYLQEDELVIDPAFFWSMGEAIERVDHVEVLQKQGAFHNEMTQFRYDVVLHLDSGESHTESLTGDTVQWNDAELNREALFDTLSQTAESVVLVKDIPNGRVAGALDELRLRRDPVGLETVADVRKARQSAGLDPQELWTFGARHGWAVEVSLARSGDPGRIDAIFSRTTHEQERLVFPLDATPPRKELRSYATDPLRGKRTTALVPRVRDSLALVLPNYMVPSAFVILDELPLNRNGKVDRRALPEPVGRRQVDVEYAPPESNLERTLVGIWEEVLHIERIGRNDNFFELGGHSLLATKVMSRVRENLGQEVPLRAVFEQPTIAGFAQRIQALGWATEGRGGHGAKADGLEVGEI